MTASVYHALGKAPRRVLGSRSASGPCKTGLLAQYTGQILDVGGVDYLASKTGRSNGQVQSGRAYTGAATIAITGLLTTDVITADSINVPTCSVNGTMTIGAGRVVYGVTVTRSAVVIGYYPCAEGGGTIAFNTLIGQTGALPHGVISTAAVHTILADGTGFDLNLDGYSLADGLYDYTDEALTDLIPENTVIPAGYDGYAAAYNLVAVYAPDQFTFTDAADVEPEILTTSNAITVLGITRPTTISITGGVYSINAGAYTGVDGEVVVDDEITVQATSGTYDGVVNVVLDIGGVTDTYTITTRAEDITPDQFSFTDADDVEPETLTTSDAITVAGILDDAPISITNGVYSINAGAYTGVVGTVSNDDEVTVQAISNAYGGTVNVVLNIGGVTDTFSISTRAAVVVPDQFTITDVTDAELETVTTSASVEVTGLEADATISIVGGSYRLNETGDFITTSSTFSPGDTFEVRVTSSDEYETGVDAVVTIGGVSDTFSVTTKTDNPYGTDFAMKFNIATDNETLTIPCQNVGTFNATIDWGDGSATSAITTWNDADLAHEYATAGEYVVRISGTFPNIYFNNVGDKLKLLEVLQLGEVGWTRLNNAFWGCSNLESFACGNTDTSNVTTMSHMFRGCTAFNQSVSDFDTSLVTSMTNMFYGCTAFNQSVSNFDTSKVTSMTYMFYGCTAFNQSVSNFDTSLVTDVTNMFYGCTAFNQSVSSFDTSKVTDVTNMFYGCTAFNQSVSSFDTSKVTNMASMFRGCTAFNQSVSSFDTSNVTNMSTMFFGCQAFNQSVSNFDTSLVTNMGDMLRGCKDFNQSVSNFDTSKVISMNSMFYGCTAFNQSVSNFDTSLVTNMGDMFYGCTAFNQSVSNFDTSLVTDVTNMFYGCQAFNQSVSNFDTSLVTTMASMFQGCNAFNQSVSNFDTSKVTSMNSMFYYGTAFNQSLASFDMANITTAASMLQWSGFALASYDPTLIAWATRPTHSISAYADGGTNLTTVTAAAAHGLQNGMLVTISGTTNYNGQFTVSAVSGLTYKINTAYVADDATGTARKDLKNAVAFHAGTAKFSAGDAADARDVIAGSPFEWVITDGGQQA